MFDGYFHSFAKAKWTPIIFFRDMQENFMVAGKKRDTGGQGRTADEETSGQITSARGGRGGTRALFVETTGIRISLR